MVAEGRRTTDIIAVMLKTIVAAVAASAALYAAGQAAGFAFDVKKPAFRVSIPSLPAIKMEPHPMAAVDKHMLFEGTGSGYTVTIMTPEGPGMTPNGCATSGVQVVAARPGVPPPQEIFKVRLDPSTYAAIYAMRGPTSVQLNAHLFSAAGGSHCVEVHATRIAKSEQDIDAWFKGFRSARIEPRK